MTKKVVSCRLDEDIFEKLVQAAQKENRSVSNYIKRALKKHIENETGLFSSGDN